MVAETDDSVHIAAGRDRRRRAACGPALDASLRADPPRLRPRRLLQPDAPHPLPQHGGAGRARGRHPLSQPVPRGPDRRARGEPADAGRDHRRRHCRLGLRRYQLHHHRSEEAARTAGRPEHDAGAERRKPGLRDQSGEGRARAPAADLADANAGAHLRQRRQPDPRFPPPLLARPGAALRPAADQVREPRHPRTHREVDQLALPASRPAALQGAAGRRRVDLSRGHAGAHRQPAAPSCGSTRTAS